MAVTQTYVLVCLVLLVTIATALASSQSLPTDCEDIQRLVSNRTGNYVIYPAEKTGGIRVRCDMDTAGGPWTVIQRRVSDSDFYRSWTEYEFGFGNLDTNFWLGNKQISLLTSQNWYQLRIGMTHENGTNAYARYNIFEVGNEASNYQLTVRGYSGNAGDALTGHNEYKFTTKDRDNDAWYQNCAVRYRGAWWHVKCHRSNLNGDYGNTEFGKGLNWYPFTGYTSSLTAVEMKVKRFQSDLAGSIDGTSLTLLTSP